MDLEGTKPHRNDYAQLRAAHQQGEGERASAAMPDQQTKAPVDAEKSREATSVEQQAVRLAQGRGDFVSESRAALYNAGLVNPGHVPSTQKEAQPMDQKSIEDSTLKNLERNDATKEARIKELAERFPDKTQAPETQREREKERER